MRRPLVRCSVLLMVLLAGCGSGVEGPDELDRDAGTPEHAITGFSGEAEDVDASFAAIHAHLGEDRDGLRAAALARLNDEDPNVHYAAMYALSLTAEPGESADALRGYLGSEDVNERFLAAGSLLARGEKAAVAVVIDLLDSEEPLAYREPPQAAWQFARTALLAFTEEDHGLADAASFAEVAATKLAWQRWWAEAGGAVEWVEEHAYYRSPP